MDNEKLSPLTLARWLRLSHETCEMMVAWQDFKDAADSNFPTNEIERYIKSRYGLKNREFDIEVEAFKNASESASVPWRTAVASEIHEIFFQEGIQLEQLPQVDLYVVRMSAYALIRVGVVTDRSRFLAVIRGARAAAACMSRVSANRAIAAAEVHMNLLAHTEHDHSWNLGRAQITSSVAIDSCHLDERKWIRKVGMQTNPAYSDFLVRALKPKLYALGIANRALEALNRRTNRR